MEALEEITERASEVVLEAGALDVLVADTPAKKKMLGQQEAVS